MSDFGAPLAFEMICRAPSQRTAGLITGMTGYRETALGKFSQRETAPLVVPVIISLGSPFLIAPGREPDATDRQRSFAAGLHIGPVHIESDCAAECVQADFTPLGAYRFFGGARISTLAREIGWSRKHLVDHFRSDLGLASKSVARMIRFHRACRLARIGTLHGWVGIAAKSGYADQAHLVREFAELAGEPPTAWARRLTLIDNRLTRPNDAISDW